MKKSLLALSIMIATLTPSEDVLACSTCGKAKNYGEYVVNEAGEATNEVNSATAQIRTGFDMMIAALQAMTANVTTEVEKSTLVEKNMLDELNRQQEQRAQAEYALKAKQKNGDAYGIDNLPMSACEDWIDAESLQRTKELTEAELREAIDDYFVEYRKASPIDDWRYHERTLTYADAGEVDMNQSLFTDEDVQKAVEYVNQTIDPLPVYPIRPDANIEELGADDRALRAQIQSLNLRLDAPKHALKEQILLKAPIVGEEQSIQSTLEKRAFESISPENLEDLATGSEMRTLRTLLRDTQYGLVMEYEQLKANLRQTRLMAMDLAANSDKYRKGYRYLEKQLDGKNAIK